jgi:hypothetical protein
MLNLRLTDTQVLVLQLPEERDTDARILVPGHLVSTILEQTHDHPLAGHLGRTKTWLRIRQHYFWDGMRKAMFRYCQSCRKCQEYRDGHKQ